MSRRKFTTLPAHADSNKTVLAFFVIWALGALLTLAFWGVVVWGIIKVVSWVIAQ